MDLLKELSLQDRDIITNYVGAYGVGDNFIGIDEWLKYWDHSNQKLYKLLGNKLIYKIPYSYKKDDNIITYEISSYLLTMNFRQIYYHFYHNYITSMVNDGIISQEIASGFLSIINIETWIKDEIPKTIKVKKTDARKMLQIQKGTKPIRALQKIMDYFSEFFEKVTDEYINVSCDKSDMTTYKKEFEEFRLKHSMILNDKFIKGNLCISIHPMDFLTMSDNDSDWSSCMSWKEKGCYRVGTVEMMNSNNVLCCYLESSKPFTFSYNNEIFEWNNKKWRTLVYFTKDIIMSGKPYPYVNDNISKFLIKIIRDLAEKNLHRHYSFGIELYKDMIHINSLQDMERNYVYMWRHDNIKHNIIWDTKGMYNDMLNDNNINYWCVRNRVKHKKIYNVSGKAPCLCCGDVIIEYDEDNEDYNDRYSNVDAVICYDCETKHRCDACTAIIFNEPLYKINKTNGKYCKKCFNTYIKRCPCCGRPIDIRHAQAIGFYKNKYASFKNPIKIYPVWNDTKDDDKTFEAFYTCSECKEKVMEKFPFEYNSLGSSYENNNKVFYYNEELESYRYRNLVSVEPGTDEKIII